MINCKLDNTNIKDKIGDLLEGGKAQVNSENVRDLGEKREK